MVEIVKKIWRGSRRDASARHRGAAGAEGSGV